MNTTSDEFYVIDLCDEILGMKAFRQYRFDFLRGDSKGGGNGRKLPVDAYYESLSLVIEYYEKQHTEDVEFFDNKMTVSGCPRKAQRKIYDERRKKVLPQHNIDLVIISYNDFKYNGKKKIVRNRVMDLDVVSKKLKNYLKSKKIR